MFNRLVSILGEENVKKNEPMSMHTTFRIGGVADIFATVNNEEDLIKVLTYLKAENIEHFIIGNGSNLLVSDSGYRGVILQLAGEFDTVYVKDESIIAGSGALLAYIASMAQDKGLAGMEFASGIPGTMGGAIVMNAGAYGGEMKDIVAGVQILWLDQDEYRIEKVSTEDMKFMYRHSILKERDGVVLSVKLKLTKGDPAAIKALMNELNDKRREKQPLNYPSAGSTFKRPEGYFAAKLIEDAGLKGYKVGQAMVSDKHAGFVVNMGGARAGEVKTLMDDVARTVKETSGVTLEPEVILLGEFV